MSNELTIKPDQTDFTPAQLSALEHLGIADASEGDRQLFLHQIQVTGLDPMRGQIWMIPRKERATGRVKYTIQVGIAGLRVIAERLPGKRGMKAPMWCGEDGVWREFWVNAKPPAACKITVTRDGSEFTAVVMYREFAMLDGQGRPMNLWAKMPANQLAKCAEAAALRLAYPADMSNIYVDAELEHENALKQASERDIRNSITKAGKERGFTGAEFMARLHEKYPNVTWENASDEQLQETLNTFTTIEVEVVE